MKLSAINIFRLVVVVIIVCLLAFLVMKIYYKHLQILEWKEQEIYEIITLDPKEKDGIIQLTSYYMVCEPKETTDEMVRQVDAFMEERDVISVLANTYAPNENLENIRFHLIFIRPTNSWPIGKFPDNNTSFDLWTDMPIGSLLVSGDEYHYSFYDADGQNKDYTVSK